MEVTLLGIVILLNEVQLWKELAPMEVTLLGIVILLNEVQLWKELAPMEVTVLGTFTSWVKLLLQV